MALRVQVVVLVEVDLCVGLIVLEELLVLVALALLLIVVGYSVADRRVVLVSFRGPTGTVTVPARGASLARDFLFLHASTSRLFARSPHGAT